MDLNIFNNKLGKNIKEAINYKNECVPKSLFKYVPLLDNRYLSYIKENKRRLSSLEDNKLWISNYKSFNDPFELKMLSIDKERINETNYNLKEIEKSFDIIRNTTFISCFSKDLNSMPMWAHYANNHKGYCIKYSVIKPQSIFPVMYEPDRVKSAVIPTNIINGINEGYANFEMPSIKTFKNLIYLYMSFLCKHNMWKYENEYRLLYINEDLKSSKGNSIELSEAGIKIEAIYIGYDCDEIYRNELVRIGKSIGCEVYKMNFDEYGEEFKLIPEKII